MVLDMQTLAELRELMGEGMAGLVDKYIELSARYLEQIQQGLVSGDVSAIEQAAHPLKSSSIQLSAMQVYEAAKIIEHEAREKKAITPQMREAIEKIGPLLQTAGHALKEAIAA